MSFEHLFTLYLTHINCVLYTGRQSSCESPKLKLLIICSVDGNVKFISCCVAEYGRHRYCIGESHPFFSLMLETWHNK